MDSVSNQDKMYQIPWRCVKLLFIFAYPEKKKKVINKGSCGSQNRKCFFSELDYVNSREEARFKGNSSNICTLVMKGGERLFISGMWPVGREGYEPGQGVSVITDGLSIGKEDARVPGSACYFESFT